MHKLYDRLIGGYEIKKHKEQWKLYQIGAIKTPFGFNWLVIILILTVIASFVFPEIRTYSSTLSGLVFLFLILKFGEYKGYNECLYDMENE